MTYATLKRKLISPSLSDYIQVSRTGSVSLNPKYVVESDGFKKQVDSIQKQAKKIK